MIITPGFAALRGKMEKDARHKELVEAAGGEFLPLVVDNFGVWTPSSVEIHHSIVHCAEWFVCMQARHFIILLND